MLRENIIPHASDNLSAEKVARLDKIAAVHPTVFSKPFHMEHQIIRNGKTVTWKGLFLSIESQF